MPIISPENRDARFIPRSRVRVLVADDSPELLEIICLLLQRDCRIEIIATAGDGCRALELVSTLSPDLAVLDVNMPHMDGLAAAARIAALHPETRVVHMSGEDSPQLREDSRISGALAFVHKPAVGEGVAAVLSSLRAPRGRLQFADA